MTNTTNTTTTATDLIGTFFVDDGIVFEVIEYKSGWFTSRSADGVEQKDRMADIQSYDPATGFGDPEEDEAATGKTTMAGQLKKYRERYTTSIAPSGRKSLSNGDPVARALEAVSLEYLYETVHELFGLDLHTKYERLNLGAQRMNLGNRIRSAYKKEDHKKHDVVVKWVESRLMEIEHDSKPHSYEENAAS